MNNNEENYLTMLEATWSILRANEEKIRLPALRAAVGDFEVLLAKVKDLAQQVMTATAGKANSKANCREALQEEVMVVARAIQAYGHRIEDLEIVEKARVVKSDLQYLRDTVLVGRSFSIYELGVENSAELVDYGVTAGKLESLKRRVDTFQAALGDREGSVARRKGARKSLRAYMNETKKLLANEIDNLMAEFKMSDPQFYNEYIEARRTKDVGLRHRERRASEAPATGPSGPEPSGSKSPEGTASVARLS